VAIEKLKIKYKANIKPGPIHKLKNVKRAMNSLIDQTTDMTQKSTTHVLKFLTPLTSSVEKTVILMGSSKFINHEI
jgi:hypothetical protein